MIAHSLFTTARKIPRMAVLGIFCCYYGLFLIVSHGDMYKTVNEPAKQMPDELTHNGCKDLEYDSIHSLSPPFAIERMLTALLVYHIMTKKTTKNI